MIRSITLSAALALGMASVSALAAPSVYPTGVTCYDPTRAYNSYVLFSELGGGAQKTRLIDMDGNLVHEWNYAGFPPVMLDPALTGGKRGHVLLQLATGQGTGTTIVPGQASEVNESIGEVDWNGKIVWQWGGAQAPGGAARQHHDLSRLPNGDTLILANIPGKLPGFTAPQQLDDVLYEVNRAGKIVWQWRLSDHLDELGFKPEELQLVKEVRAPDFLHVNNARAVGPNHWFHDGDKRFDPNNIIFCSRDGNFTAIIDKKSGHIVWEIGPDYPRSRGGGAQGGPAGAGRPGWGQQQARPVDQIIGQHDAHMIPKGLPGAGNILIFDNQGTAGYPEVAGNPARGSRVIEVDPVAKTIVWEYTARNSHEAPSKFYAWYISSARRLPNGNTLIDEGPNGRVFQVTKEGDIVWEYINPYFQSGMGGSLDNQIYRAQPVSYDWVPAGTPHSENPVTPPDNEHFRMP